MEEDPGEACAEDEGGGHACHGDGDGAFEVFLDDVDAEFHADDEHVEGEAELGGWKEVALGVAGLLGGVPGEDGALDFWEEESEKGGAEEDACDHFCYDLWLAEACGDASDEPAE